MDARYHLTRRQLVQGAGAVGLCLLAGCMQPSSPSSRAQGMRRIGFFTGDAAASAAARYTEPFRQGLHERGWIEGQNVVVDWHYGNGSDEHLAEPMAELAKVPVDVMVVVSATLARMARATSTEIPIVVTGGAGNLLSTGLVSTLARPEGNITGLTNLPEGLNGKRLQLLTETVPGIARLVALADRASIGQGTQLKVDAQALGLEVRLVEVQTVDDVENVFGASPEQMDALSVLSGPAMATHRTQIIKLAAKYGVPAIYPSRAFMDVGGLMAYQPDVAALSRRAAYYVDRILKGAKPADLPVELPMRFDFLINLQTAQALGLTIPPHVLLQATEVIQ
jgi:putative tryptophan/tyrosine transport system substrate-binding protein